jgi:hypothetical protein
MANRGQPTVAGEPVLLPEEIYELATEPDLYDFDVTLRLSVPLTIGGLGKFEVANTTFTGWIVSTEIASRYDMWPSDIVMCTRELEAVPFGGMRNLKSVLDIV